MRKIRFVFVVYLLYTQTCFAQWQSLTTNIGANDCQFITPCKGIAVEGNGRVYQTFFSNPTSNEIVIKKSLEGTGSIHYEVVDFLGRVYLKGTLDDSELELSLGFLPAALYFLKISENNRIRSYKILKQ